MPNFSLSDEVFAKAAAEFPTPFHLYDEGGIRRTARALNKAFSWCENFKEYFAVKALPNPAILRILKEEGCGVDCSSSTELMLADACGFHGADIMFSANAMPAEELAQARSLDAFINLDDITHIEKLRTHGGVPECICCRYNPGGDFTIGTTIMGNPGEAKYGFTYPQLEEGLAELKRLGAKTFGLHAFLSSNTIDNAYYPTLAELLFETGRKLMDKVGMKLAFVNLSGGVGIPYRPSQEPNDIMAIGEGVHQAYDEVLVPAGMDDVAIYTEMGRFILGPYGALVAQCIHQKHTYKEYAGLDACAANLMRPAMYGAYHHITVLGKENALCDHTYDVTGGLCENNDKFAVDRNLPQIDIGDYVYIHDTGAHGFSMGYNYNAKLRSAELLLCEDGSVEMIRRAETPKDYFATFDFTGLFDNIK